MPLYPDRDHGILAHIASERLERRALQEFQGIAMAVCFDGKVDDSELNLVRTWLNNHAALWGAWPFDRIVELLRRILADGVVTTEERRELLATLRQYSAETHAPAGTIFDDDAVVVVAGRSFAITGASEFFDREALIKRLKDCGATVHDSVRPDTDYLVVGAEGSDLWVTSRYGTKIESAMDYQRRGGRIKVVRDYAAIDALVTCELARGVGGTV